MKRTLFFLFLGMFLFWGCSKDDSPKKENQEISKTGKFIDSVVEGVRYETETHSGYTDENGNYEYEEGETVTFYVGDIMLGSALATGELSPIDIASTPDATIYTPEVQNIAAFLQTLDNDGDASNGIMIEQEILNAISLTSIDFTQPILQLLGETVLEIFQKTGKDLDVVFPVIATTHLAESLNLDYDPDDNFLNNSLLGLSNFFEREENYYTYQAHSRAVNWVYHFGENGKLKKATVYEKYPSRIVLEILFSEFKEEQSFVEIEVKETISSTAINSRSSDYKILYNSDYVIQRILKTDTVTSSKLDIEVKGFTDKNLFKTIIKTDHNGTSRIDYSYDSKGRLILAEATEVDNIPSTTEFTYTNFGDISSIITKKEIFLAQNFYKYRNDNTLENIDFRVDYDTKSYTEGKINLDEEERYLKINKFAVTQNGTYRDISYYENGYIYLAEHYSNDILSNKLYFECTNSGDYCRIYKEEVFDEEGNIINTYTY